MRKIQCEGGFPLLKWRGPHDKDPKKLKEIVSWQDDGDLSLPELGNEFSNNLNELQN
jgi:hypothetical protein